MNSSKVYIPQEPMRRIEGRWVSKGLNIAPAVEWGSLVIVWGPDAPLMSREVVMADALRVASAYNEERDWVLSLGSPTLIAVLGWAIGTEGKRLRVLEWDREMRRYYPTLGDKVTA